MVERDGDPRWGRQEIRGGVLMTESQAWILIVEVGVIAVSYLVGMVRR